MSDLKKRLRQGWNYKLHMTLGPALGIMAALLVAGVALVWSVGLWLPEWVQVLAAMAIAGLSWVSIDYLGYLKVSHRIMLAESIRERWTTRLTVTPAMLATAPVVVLVAAGFTVILAVVTVFMVGSAVVMACLGALWMIGVAIQLWPITLVAIVIWLTRRRH